MTQEIDLDAINELKELMEDDFVVLLEAFVTDSAAKFAELEAAVSERNADEIRKTAHSLKGSSSNLGAVKLADACYTLEAMGRKEELDGVDERLQEVSALLESASKQFTAMIAES